MDRCLQAILRRVPDQPDCFCDFKKFAKLAHQSGFPCWLILTSQCALSTEDARVDAEAAREAADLAPRPKTQEVLLSAQRLIHEGEKATQGLKVLSARVEDGYYYFRRPFHKYNQEGRRGRKKCILGQAYYNHCSLR